MPIYVGTNVTAEIDRRVAQAIVETCLDLYLEHPEPVLHKASVAALGYPDLEAKVDAAAAFLGMTIDWDAARAARGQK